MSYLTPEEWRALDEAERAFDGLDAAVYLTMETEHRVVTRLRDKLQTHARALIDAARPKCKTCDGGRMVKRMRPGLTRISGGDYLHVEECPDCNGTGWAA